MKHELNLKTDLLHAYTDNEIEAAEESEEDDIAVVGLETSSSGLAIKSKDGSKGRRRKLTAANVELIERKVKHLKEDNKKLQEEATEVSPKSLDLPETCFLLDKSFTCRIVIFFFLQCLAGQRSICM